MSKCNALSSIVADRGVHTRRDRSEVITLRCFHRSEITTLRYGVSVNRRPIRNENRGGEESIRKVWTWSYSGKGNHKGKFIAPSAKNKKGLGRVKFENFCNLQFHFKSLISCQCLKVISPIFIEIFKIEDVSIFCYSSVRSQLWYKMQTSILLTKLQSAISWEGIELFRKFKSRFSSFWKYFLLSSTCIATPGSL